MLNNVALPGRKTVIAVMLSVKCAKTWENAVGAGLRVLALVYVVVDHDFMVLRGLTFQMQRYYKKPYFAIADLLTFHKKRYTAAETRQCFAPEAHAASGGAECGTWSTQFGKERARISEITRIWRTYGRGGDFRFCGNFLHLERKCLTINVNL